MMVKPIVMSHHLETKEWWPLCSENGLALWHIFFQDLEFEGVLDSSCKLRMESLWYWFGPGI